MTGSNQYPPMRGLPELRAAVARHYGRFQGLTLAPEHVLVTSGATEALAATLSALLHPGDGVLTLDPAYDAYRPILARAGRTAVALALEPPDWRLDLDAVEAALTANTRAILLNSPMNPTGRAFDRAELAGLARLCVKHDLLAICDEVWEHVIFDDRSHTPLLSLPGMAERTVKIGSAGKIFSMTGWKVGFVIAAPELLEPIARAHQYLTFTTPPALQTAIAAGLDWPEAWFAEARAGYARSRDRLAAALRAEGFSPLPCEGTYFLCVDLAASGIDVDAQTFCTEAVTRFAVASIPLTSFYAAPDKGPPLIRLCFAKSDDTLDAGALRLAAARQAFL
jgi:aspartate/methionine/tyrosine aminotransferase